MLAIFVWSESFVERIVNEKGSKPEYGFPSLSFISRVRVAASPSLSGDFVTSVATRSFCVIKCVAISLKFSKVSDNVLWSKFCEVVVGITGTTISGIVGGVRTTTGVVGTIGVVGCIGTVAVGGVTVGGIIVGVIGVVIGNICGTMIFVPVFIIGSVESPEVIIWSVGTVVLLL